METNNLNSVEYCKTQILDYLSNTTCKFTGKPVIYSTVRSVSKSGMQRQINLYCICGAGQLYNVTFYVAKILNDKMKNDNLVVNGCGFNVLDDTVMRLSKALFNDSYKIDSRNF